jgi:hypothetical protein
MKNDWTWINIIMRTVIPVHLLHISKLLNHTMLILCSTKFSHFKLGSGQCLASLCTRISISSVSRGSIIACLFGWPLIAKA